MFDAIFVQPLINVLFFIYGILPGHDFGLSVIIMTAIIRLVMWPVMAKQLHSQKKMQALQPEIARVRAEAAGDKQKESAMLMELYKQKEINPLASCLPLIIQLPFLIALFAVFNRATQGFDVVTPLLYGPVKDLSWISQVINNPELFSAELFGLVDLAAKNNIVLALIAGATQYYQVWQITPKNADPSDPSAATNKMMTWMFPFLTAWIGYTLVAALPLYWAVSNGISILQQSLTMKEEVDKMEEAKVVTKVREVQSLKISKKGKGKSKTKRKRG